MSYLLDDRPDEFALFLDLQFDAVLLTLAYLIELGQSDVVHSPGSNAVEHLVDRPAEHVHLT